MLNKENPLPLGKIKRFCRRKYAFCLNFLFFYCFYVNDL